MSLQNFLRNIGTNPNLSTEDKTKMFIHAVQNLKLKDKNIVLKVLQEKSIQIPQEAKEKILAKYAPETVTPKPTAETEAPKAEQTSTPNEETKASENIAGGSTQSSSNTTSNEEAKAGEDAKDDNTKASSNINEPQEEIKVNFFSAVWSAFKELLEKYHFIEAENDLLNSKNESVENDYTKFGSEYNEQSENIDGFNSPNNE